MQRSDNFFLPPRCSTKLPSWWPQSNGPGEGRKRAQANGVKFGRPRALNPHQREEALKRIEAGETYTAIARSYAVDPNTISRWLCGRLIELAPDRFNDFWRD